MKPVVTRHDGWLDSSRNRITVFDKKPGHGWRPCTINFVHPGKPSDKFDLRSEFEAAEKLQIHGTKLPNNQIELFIARYVKSALDTTKFIGRAMRRLAPTYTISTGYGIVRPSDIERKLYSRQARIEEQNSVVYITSITRYVSNSGTGYAVTFDTPHGVYEKQFTMPLISITSADKTKLIELLWMINYLNNPFDEEVTCKYKVILDYKIIPDGKGIKRIYTSKLSMQEVDAPEKLLDFIRTVFVRQIMDK